MCTLHTVLAFVVFLVGGGGGRGRRSKTNMMAIDYNLTYNLTIGKNSTSLGIKEPATSY